MKDNRPETKEEAFTLANSPRVCWYSSSCGKVELAIALGDARSGHHQGACDDDIAALARVPYIAEQLNGIGPDTAREVATESGRNDYGHGDDDMSDHAANLAFILWIACGDIIENERDRS